MTTTQSPEISGDDPEREAANPRGHSPKDAIDFRDLLELSVDGFWEWHPRSGFSYLSPGLRRLAGYDGDRGSQAPTSLLDLFEKDDANSLRAAAEGQETSTGPFTLQIQMICQSGERCWVEIRGHRVDDVKDDTLRIRGTMRDISHEMRTEVALVESERRLTLALDGSAQAVWDWNLANGELYVSQHWRSLLRHAEHPDQAPILAHLLHPKDRRSLMRRLRHCLKSRFENCGLEFRLADADGTFRWFHARGQVAERDPAGRPIRIVGTLADVDEHRLASETRHLAAALIEHAKESIVMTDAQNRIVTVNPAFTAMTGYTPDEAAGRDPGYLSSGRQSRTFYRKMWQTLKKTGAWEGELWNRRKNGEEYPQWLSVSVVRDPDQRVTHYIGIASDNSERQAIRERLEHLAHYDNLTGLPNRMLVRDRLLQGLRNARREKTSLALLFIDIDRFKSINDTLGHAVGDALLRSVAERLSKSVRDIDTVGRTGGDEFIVVLPEASHAAASQIARRILDHIGQPHFVRDHELSISSSIGVALYPTDGSSVDALIQHADTAMYHAKHAGRSTIRFFAEGMQTQALRQFEMSHALRKALTQGHFHLHYQPRIDIATGQVKVLEALIRWQTAEGLVLPARFLPIASQCGLIGQIDEWVLYNACRQMRAWHDAGLTQARLAVNVSAIRFVESAFGDRVAEILSATGLDPDSLELEITERTTLELAEASANMIIELRRMGVSVSIDDFGTGHSSMAYLKSFRVDKLKIDRCFIAGLPDDHESVAITDAIIHLAAQLGNTVIAKGVETPIQLEAVRRRGIRFAEGRLIGAPLPPEAIPGIVTHPGRGYPTEPLSLSLLAQPERQAEAS